MPMASADAFLVTCERHKFRRFAADKADVDVVFEDEWVTGFQLSIVQQWLTDRTKLLKSVVVYTGNAAHSMLVSVVKFSAGAFQQCFGELRAKNMRPMSTALGDVLVTNLARVPPSLNLVLVPDGDFERAVAHMTLSINLRRLGCSGRIAVTLRYPGEAKDKFYSLYKVSPHVPLEFAAVELVRLAQLALHLYDLLPVDVCDGLLCDLTLEALRSYTVMCGLQTEEDHDDVLQYPRVFAHLFSSIQITRALMQTLGFVAPKDPFADVAPFRKAICAYQESRELEPTGAISAVLMRKLQFEGSLQDFQPAPILKSSKATGADATKPTTDLELCLKHTSFDRLKYLCTGTGKSFVDVDAAPYIPEGLREGIKRATDKFIRPIEGTVDGIVGLSRGAYKGMKNTPANIAHSFKEKRARSKADALVAASSTTTTTTNSSTQTLPSRHDGDDPLLLVDESANSTPSATNTPVISAASVGPAAARVRNALKQPLSVQSSAEYDEALEALQTQESIFQGRRAELEKIETPLDAQITAARDALERRNTKYAAFEQVLREDVLPKTSALVHEMEAIENGSSKLQYQVGVVRDKLQETQELIGNYSAVIASLETQVRSSFAFRFAQLAEYLMHAAIDALFYLSSRVFRPSRRASVS